MAGALFYGEKVTWFMWTGTIFIIGGPLFVNLYVLKHSLSRLQMYCRQGPIKLKIVIKKQKKGRNGWEMVELAYQSVLRMIKI